MCVSMVVPTVVNVLIWASSHRLHIFSAACVPTRPRSKSRPRSQSQQSWLFRCIVTSSRCGQSDIHQPSVCSECKYSTIIQFGRVYLAHQSDRAVVSNLEWEKLAEVGTCGGQTQERDLKINYLWTWIAWTLQTCWLLSSFNCFASCMCPFTSKIKD